jgi:hypothetical protein
VTITTEPFPDGGVVDVFADGRLIGWYDDAPTDEGLLHVRDWDGERIGKVADTAAAIALLTGGPA